MNYIVRCPLIFCLIVAMAAPAAFAGAPDTFDADARFAEGNPPVIPHRYNDNASGAECLSCHWDMQSKAPLCRHPKRLACTQCHVRSVSEQVQETKK